MFGFFLLLFGLFFLVYVFFFIINCSVFEFLKMNKNEYIFILLLLFYLVCNNRV